MQRLPVNRIACPPVRLFVYVVVHDTGFAPNPFFEYCTLATCKPGIRRSARVGDWIAGIGSVQRGQEGKLVFAMRVAETMCFDEYWHDSRFVRNTFIAWLEERFAEAGGLAGDPLDRSDTSPNCAATPPVRRATRRC